MTPGNPKRKATDSGLDDERSKQKDDDKNGPPENEEGDEEKICRFCFDGPEDSNPLISPCDCKGGQKYIHLSCLRQWQRMVLMSQPTHPDFWEEDERHVSNIFTFDWLVAYEFRSENAEHVLLAAATR